MARALVVTGLAWVGCLVSERSPDVIPELSHAHVPLIQLHGELVTDATVLAIPSKLAVVGDYLLVIDLASDSALHLVDRTTGSLVRSFGRRGGGPAEISAPWSLDPVRSSKTEAWVYDFDLKRMTYIDVSVAGATPISSSRYLHLRDASMITGLAWFGRDSLAALGYFMTGRVALFDGNGMLRGVRAPIPVFGENPILVRQHAYQATLVPHPDRHRFAAATRHASRIEFYRSDGTPMGVGEGPLPVRPRRAEGRIPANAGYVAHAESRFGYVDATGSTDFVFALFSGRTMSGYTGHPNFGRFVHVFDWQGNFKTALELEHDAVAIATDETGQTLYVLQHEPRPSIVRYSCDLPAGT